MNNLNLNEIKHNFTEAAQQFKLSDCFTLQPFVNRYQATLILGAYTSAIFFSPLIVSLLLAPLNSIIMASALICMAYGGYRLYASQSEGVEANQENAQQQPPTFARLSNLFSSVFANVEANNEDANQEQAAQQSENGQNNRNKDIFKAGCALFGASLSLSLAQYLLPLIISFVMAHRTYHSIPQESLPSLDNVRDSIKSAFSL